MRTWQPFTAKETASRVIGWLPHVVDCPNDKSGLTERLSGCENYLLTDGDEDLGWMALQQADAWGICGFVIRPEFRNRWLSREVLRSFADKVFTPTRPVVLFDTKVPEVLKLALRLGAKRVYDSGVNGQYGLTADSLKGRLH